MVPFVHVLLHIMSEAYVLILIRMSSPGSQAEPYEGGRTAAELVQVVNKHARVNWVLGGSVGEQVIVLCDDCTY